MDYSLNRGISGGSLSGLASTPCSTICALNVVSQFIRGRRRVGASGDFCQVLRAFGMQLLHDVIAQTDMCFELV